MESIEQLKLENEKLNARLNKAVEVFKEQKSQIESLTDELNKYKESFNESASIEELQKVIESKDQANKILQETYDNVFSDYTTLKEKIAEFKTTIQSLEELKENHIKEIQGRNEQIDKSDKEIYNLDNLLNESRTNYDELNKKYETLNEKYKALHETYNKTKNLYDEDIHKYNDLKNIHKEIKEQNFVLQEKLDKNTEEIKVLENENINNKSIIKELESIKINNEQLINDLSKELESKGAELTKNKNKQLIYEDFVKNIIKLLGPFRNVEETKQPDNPPLKSKIPVKPNSTNNPFMSDAVGMNI